MDPLQIPLKSIFGEDQEKNLHYIGRWLTYLQQFENLQSYRSISIPLVHELLEL